MDIQEHLAQLERQLQQRMTPVTEHEVSNLIADDFVEFGASGHVWSKSDVIDGLKNEEIIGRSISDFSAKQLAEKVMLVTYRCHNHASALRSDCWSLRSSIWTLKNGHWQMTFHQGTPLVCADISAI
ncbi:DUF4440 domain-containing protein [Pseudomonas sp. NA-150]|uniref:nuclear transport factor 2 family protein n=1 Tax=Pseudomonas sp. NA-150 TaxID=3367525 RepID=UPI0037C5C10B